MKLVRLISNKNVSYAEYKETEHFHALTGSPYLSNLEHIDHNSTIDIDSTKLLPHANPQKLLL